MLIQVAGDASERQVLLAVHSYVERQELLLASLNNLFHLFKQQICSNHKRALEVGFSLVFRPLNTEAFDNLSFRSTLSSHSTVCLTSSVETQCQDLQLSVKGFICSS